MTAAMGKRMRVALLAAAAVALIAATTAPTLADTRLCRQLEAELASAAGSGGSAKLREYDDAVARQREELLKARRQARGARCGFSLFGNGVRQCATLNATIEKMQINLEALQSRRGQLAGSGKGKSRTRLLASLDANGCRDAFVAERRLPPGIEDENGEANSLERIFGDETDGLQPLDGDLEGRIRRVINGGEETDVAGLGAGYRTLCVRTCDGYFFPMSYSASVRDFARDQKNCDAMCPGADMQVFFHDPETASGGNPAVGEESKTMVSTATGKPYSELPTAYLYKRFDTPRPKGCGCNAARDFEVLAGKPPAGDAPPAESGSFITPPVPQPESIPEIRIDESNGADGQEPAAPREPDADRKVRVVGPVFLPDPEAAIDLQAPAPKQVP